MIVVIRFIPKKLKYEKIRYNTTRTFITIEELFVLYDKKYDTLNLKEGEWQEKYGIPEIIEFIYGILEENND